jgi:hypothetical protein
MSDTPPVLTNHYIIQVAFQGPSGIPRDQFENIWHFIGNGGSSDVELAACFARIGGFYNGVQTGTGNKVAGFLSDKMSRSVLLKGYVEEDLKPRPIRAQATMTLGNPGSTVALPEEVALCMSYYSLRNLPRQRGRIYLGPLNAGAVEQDTDPRPSADFVNTIVQAAAPLLTPADGTVEDYGYFSGIGLPVEAQQVTWALRSGRGGPVKVMGEVDYQIITAGWVDNEWDGQSRRRISASARVHFGPTSTS